MYKNDVTPKAQFEYAWCLVRSKYSTDIRKGIILLEELYKNHEAGQRDYLYYLAIGNARLKEYSKAMGYVRSFLAIEPGTKKLLNKPTMFTKIFSGNQQVLNLQQIIKKKMEKEGLMGIAVTTGAVLAVGAIVGIGMAIAGKTSK